jgi:threonine dehydrogenase-like Zn-dependent dehydrogenase
VRTRRGGICGSDLNVITLHASPSTSPFSSFPFVFGHEIAGEIAELGQAVRGFAAGERVVVNPLLSCVPRGIQPRCTACSAGHPSRCRHFTDGALPPGLLIGTTRALGGSWGEYLVAHATQLHRVPDSMSDDEAVLVEPLACSVHAVRSALPAHGEQVLVVGAGSIGLLTVAALHALAPAAKITVLARHRFQGEHATRLGATRVVFARGDYTEELAAAAEARLLKPILGRQVAVGGFDRTFLCVGEKHGADDALRFTREGGTVVMLGNAGSLDGLDWTFLWFKELMLRGSLCYGAHMHAGATRPAFEEAIELISNGLAPVGPLLTHSFALTDYRRALDTAMGKAEARSVKVAFRF